MSSTSLSGIFPAGTSPVAFDTLRYSKRLQALGFTQAQAEGFAEIQRELIDERLATKADLYAVKADLELKIEATRADVHAAKADLELKIETTRKDLSIEIARLSDQMTIRTGGMMAAAIAVVTALVKLL